MIMRFAISAAGLLVSIVTASAGGPPPLPPVKGQQSHPCVAEVAKFCNDVPFGNGERIACLERHNAELTPFCRERVKILRVMFDYGQAQHRKTMATLAKQHAELANQKKSAPNAKAPAPPPPQ